MTMNVITWINIICTVIVILLSLLNIYLVPILSDKFIQALEKDVTRILRDKGVF